MTDFSFPPPPPPPPKALASNDHINSSTRGRGGNYGGHGSRGRGSNRGDRSRGSGIRGSRGSRGASMHSPLTHQNTHASTSAFQLSPQDSRIGDKRKIGADHYGSQRPLQVAKSNGHFNPRQTSTTAKQKVEAAPAVPSFGLALPLPVSVSNTSQGTQGPAPLVKGRKEDKPLPAHNKLGLTPNVGDEELSEDDEGEEEAARFVATGPVKFEHQGRTWTLSSPEEWKSWIEERRRHWPTKGRVEMKKQADTERMRLREEATKRAREAKLKEEQEAFRKKVKESLERRMKTQADGGGTEQDSQPPNGIQRRKEREEEKMLKAKKELEKSIQRTKKIQERLSKFQALSKSDDAAVDDTDGSKEAIHYDEPPIHTPHLDSGQTATPKLPGEESHQETVNASEGGRPDGPGPTSPASSSLSDNESDTDESSSSSGAPDEESAQAQKLIRVPPPPRQGNRGLCSFWMQGKCRNGRLCKFSHETDANTQGTSRQHSKTENDRDTTRSRRTRKRLYERLVEQEVAAEERQLIKAIKALGDQGFFDA